MLWRSVAGHALANLATELYSTKNVIFIFLSHFSLHFPKEQYHIYKITIKAVWIVKGARWQRITMQTVLRFWRA